MTLTWKNLLRKRNVRNPSHDSSTRCSWRGMHNWNPISDQGNWMYHIFPRANKIVSRSHKPKLTTIGIFEGKEEHTARREVEPCAFAFVEFSYKTMDTTSFCKLRRKSEVGVLKIRCAVVADIPTREMHLQAQMLCSCTMNHEDCLYKICTK